MALLEIAAIDPQPSRASGAHVAKGVLSAGADMPPLKRSFDRQATGVGLAFKFLLGLDVFSQTYQGSFDTLLSLRSGGMKAACTRFKCFTRYLTAAMSRFLLTVTSNVWDLSTFALPKSRPWAVISLGWLGLASRPPPWPCHQSTLI
jgi:hypothetical protein